MEKCKSCVTMILIFLCSLILMSIMTKNNPDVFVVDDNAIQWEPVIEKSYDYLFAHHKIPYVDFYQYKKLNLLDAGYYALLNPFMLLAYVVNRYLLSSSYKILGLYIILLFASGNVMMYALLKRLGIRTSNTLLMVFAYSAVSFFVDWGFYYFSFNNYFFLPFFLLVVFCTAGHKLQYLLPGICLSFGLYLGHVQYACFYYMAYGIVMLYVTFKNHVKYFFSLCSNVVISLCLSAPQLLLTLQAGASRSAIISDTEGFLAMPVSLPSLAIHFAVPKFFSLKAWRMALDHVSSDWWLNSWLNNRAAVDGLSLNYVYLGMILPLFVLFFAKDIKKLMQEGKRVYGSLKKQKCAVSSYKDYAQMSCRHGIARIQEEIRTQKREIKKYALAYLLAVLLIATNLNGRYFVYAAICLLFVTGFFWVLHKRAQGLSDGKKDHGQDLADGQQIRDFIYAVAFAALFFLLFSYGTKGILALFFQHIPVFNSFRFLYKAMFIAIPCMVVPAAFALEQLCPQNKIRLIQASVCVLSCVGIFNLYFILNSGMGTYYNNPVFDYNDPDLEHEIKDQIEELALDTENYRFLAVVSDHIYGNYIDTSSAECWQKITKNMATKLGVFSLGGYDNTFSYDSYKQSSFIFEDIIQNNMYTNAINGQEYFVDCIQEIEKNQSSNSTYNYYVAQLEEQWQRCAIKYILADQEAVRTILQMFRYFPHISTGKIQPFYKDTVVIELKGVDSLGKTDTGQKAGITSDLAYLDIAIGKEATQLELSFVYDPHYLATYFDEDGNEQVCKVEKTKKGYVTIDLTDCGAGHIQLEYRSRLCDLAVLFAAITSVCCIGILIVCYYESPIAKRFQSRDP